MFSAVNLLLAAAMMSAATAAQVSPAGAPALGKVFKDCADCPEMVVIPAGEFLMGVQPNEEDRENLSDEFRHRSEPQHRVRVRGFSAGKYEVTRAQYRVFAAETGRGTDGCFFWNGNDYEWDTGRDWRNTGYPQSDNHPVACVSWEDATAYTLWLSRRTGKKYRLLTEAEWEYAARGDTATSRFWGDDGNASCACANGADLAALRQVSGAINWPVANCDDGYAYTAPAGTYRANAFGLHDMLGNVWEWTADCWNPDYRGAPADETAATSGDCFMRVVRGGSWDDSPAGMRAGYRVGSPMVIRVYGRGFRVATSD